MADGGDDETGVGFLHAAQRGGEIPFTQPTEQKYEVPSVLVDLSSDLEFCLPAAGSKATGCLLVEGLEQEKIFTYFPLCSKQSREPRPNDFQCNALFA